MDNYQKFFVVFLELVSLVLIVLHTINNNLRSDYVTIFLLIFMAVLPLIPKIKIFRYKDSEIVIGKEDVDKLEESVENIPENPAEDDPYSNFEGEIYNIARYNLTSALLTLRVELEIALRNLYSSTTENPKKQASIMHIVEELSKKKILDKDGKHALIPYIAFFNRLSHGEKFAFEDEDEIHTVIKTSIKLIKFIHSLYSPNQE